MKTITRTVVSTAMVRMVIMVVVVVLMAMVMLMAVVVVQMSLVIMGVPNCVKNSILLRMNIKVGRGGVVNVVIASFFFSFLISYPLNTLHFSFRNLYLSSSSNNIPNANLSILMQFLIPTLVTF